MKKKMNQSNPKIRKNDPTVQMNRGNFLYGNEYEEKKEKNESSSSFFLFQTPTSRRDFFFLKTTPPQQVAPLPTPGPYHLNIQKKQDVPSYSTSSSASVTPPFLFGPGPVYEKGVHQQNTHPTPSTFPLPCATQIQNLNVNVHHLKEKCNILEQVCIKQSVSIDTLKRESFRPSGMKTLSAQFHHEFQNISPEGYFHKFSFFGVLKHNQKYEVFIALDQLLGKSLVSF